MLVGGVRLSLRFGHVAARDGRVRVRGVYSISFAITHWVEVRLARTWEGKSSARKAHRLSLSL